jgi:hypothetical protein
MIKEKTTTTKIKEQEIKKFFEKFTKFFPIQDYGIPGTPFENLGTYPKLVTIKDKEYDNYPCIVIGDDTEIVCSNKAGKFDINDYHDENNKTLKNLSGKNVIDYYLGKNTGYLVDFYKEKPLYFRLGFRKVLDSLFEVDL